jgi:short-subunit dehydrogenase
MPIPNKSLYAATKSFIYTFSQSLFYELRPLNIHVCCLCPGGTLTERVRRELGEKKLNRTKFCQSPEEVAAIAVEAMYRKKFRIIPGWYNRVLFWLSQTLPDAIKIQIIELAFKREAPKGNSPAYLASRLKPIALITR